MKEQLTFKEVRRIKLRMTQTEFAEALGVSRRTVARYEATGAPPSILKLTMHILKHPPRRVLPSVRDSKAPTRTSLEPVQAPCP